MKKRVLVLSQVIPPWFVDTITNALGEDVIVDFITGSKINGNVIPSPVYEADGFVSKFISWIKYYLFVRKWAKKNKKSEYNLIFATSNPPINSFLGLRLKKQFNVPFVMMNWDVYPQCIDLMIKNPVVHLICKIWHKCNNRNYPRIDKMVTIGDIVAQSINQDIENKIDIKVIPVGVDTKELTPKKKEENIFCINNNLVDKFIVLYSGKMGFGHNIELILQAAEKLKEYEDICFVFIGSGQKFNLVKDYCQEHQSKNIQLYPLQPDEMFPYSMACGDVGIVAEEIEMARLFMPSKTYSMIACGMPVIGICSDDDDLYNTVTEKEIGYCVTDNKVDSLCKYIIELYEDKEKLNSLKKTARECAEKYYDLAVITEEYRELFEKYL